MWHDDNDDIMKLYDLLKEHGSDPLPAKCPVCGENGGHIYMHRYDEENHGGMWVWCSSCHNYSHSSCKVPEWWRNKSDISIVNLQASPQYLNTKAESVDSFVNRLFAIHDDKTIRSAGAIKCEKCGTTMIKEMPEKRTFGGYSLFCPKCGWGWATTYIDPICNDDTQYQIILLEGNDTSAGVVRAVNKVTHLSLIKAKQVIEKAPQMIYQGDALEIYEMKRLLDEVSVKYRIEPDYLYEYF